MSQIWAQAAAHHYGFINVYNYSGGTESTAFNSRSVRALLKAGFDIEQTDSSANPVCLVRYAEGKEPIKGFSKKYDDEFNPRENFVAIMTCSHADKNCPIVYGATLRVAIPYDLDSCFNITRPPHLQVFVISLLYHAAPLLLVREELNSMAYFCLDL